jgi:alpha-tubulin suppressor-like RCC1 family protein
MGGGLAPAARSRWAVAVMVVMAAGLGWWGYAVPAVAVVPPAGVVASLADVAQLPAGLRAAAGQIAMTPSTLGGVSARWGRGGVVSFRRGGATMVLRPLSAGRGLAAARAWRPGAFALGKRMVTESLAPGMSVWYKRLAAGFEQGFTVASRPPGAGLAFSLNVGYSGDVTARLAGPGRIIFTGERRAALAYGGLRVADSRGRRLSARLTIGAGVLRITVRDAGAAYPVTVDPYIIPALAGGIAPAQATAETPQTSPGVPTGWGSNSLGALGAPTSDGPAPVTVPDETGTTQVSMGCSHALYLHSDGTVWASGWNGWGQLGDGNSTDSTTPVQVTGLSNVVAIAAGCYHSVALLSDGTVWLWGQNQHVTTSNPPDGTCPGFGGGNPVQCFVHPTQWVGPASITQIAAGTLDEVALAADGTVYTGGQIGNAHLSLPAPVTDVAMQSYQAEAIAGGQVYQWGLTSGSTPAVVPGITGVATALGGDSLSGYAVTADGSVWAWGDDRYGQLGDGGTTRETTAIKVSGLPHIVAVAGGFWHAVALDSSGGVWAWGDNVDGEVGPQQPQQVDAVPSQVPDIGPAVAITAGGYTTITLLSGLSVSSTTTSVSSSFDPSAAGQPVTYTATVSGPSGTLPSSGETVAFDDDGSPVPGCGAVELSATSPYTATCAVTYTSAAGSPHAITAAYSGDPGNAPSTSPVLSQTVNAAVNCTGYGIQVGTTSAADLCDAWPSGAPPAGVTPDSSGRWTLTLTGTITLPGSGDWIFCVADTQDFTMSIDGTLALTNEIYEQDGNNGDINFELQGTYAGTMAVNCEDAVLASGQHSIEIDVHGSVSQVTSYNIGYMPPGASTVTGLHLSLVNLTQS